MPRYFKMPLSFMFPHQNPLCVSHVPHMCHTPSTSHLTLLDVISLLIGLCGEQCKSRSSSLCSFLQSPVTSSLFTLRLSNVHHKSICKIILILHNFQCLLSCSSFCYLFLSAIIRNALTQRTDPFPHFFMYVTNSLCYIKWYAKDQLCNWVSNQNGIWYCINGARTFLSMTQNRKSHWHYDLNSIRIWVVTSRQFKLPYTDTEKESSRILGEELVLLFVVSKTMTWNKAICCEISDVNSIVCEDFGSSGIWRVLAGVPN
jgi:hypothetical protein